VDRDSEQIGTVVCTVVSVTMQNELNEKWYELSDIIIFWYIKKKKYKYSCSHDISLPSWKPKVQDCIHMSLPPDPTLNHVNQINILTPFITDVHFSIILPSLSFIFATKLLAAPHYTLLPNFTTLNLLKISIFLQPHYFLSLTSKYTIFSSFMFLPLSYTQTDNFYQPCALSLS